MNDLLAAMSDVYSQSGETPQPPASAGSGDDDAGLSGRKARLNGSAVELTYRDDGVGMSDAVRARIFEPFFTTKKVGQGTGLGLAIVAKIVDDHRGTIRLDSNSEGGARFRVFLPAASKT